jgi:(E)-4-hydroxy-3-methylbut-2-enyl-diphosphate synthase
MQDFLAEGIFNVNGYRRRVTPEVKISSISLGGNNPVRLQTMTTTNTNDIPRSVDQCIRAINAGAELVRLTTQGINEAKSLGQIKNELVRLGYETPVIADIHFNPEAAIEAANYADKIRINPGNFSDKSRTSKVSFSEEDYEQDLLRAEARFFELLNICKQKGVAIRIGVNHGSLSQRIMSRYGDTPIGMAQSAIEFLSICKKHNHQQVVVSMKSSNTRVMVQATRLLVKMMNDQNLNFPLHLGVTEAGEGEDGRIKSAVGIGALLIDGIGDTIRVSLTEEPENEIPVARELVNIFSGWENVKTFHSKIIPINPYDYQRRKTISINSVGGDNPPVVIAKLCELNSKELAAWGWTFSKTKSVWEAEENAADYIFVGSAKPDLIENPETLPFVGRDQLCKHRLISYSQLVASDKKDLLRQTFVELETDLFENYDLNLLANYPSAILILNAKNPHSFYSIRNFIFQLIAIGIENPCIIGIDFPSSTQYNFQIQSSAILGPLFIDGLGDGLMIFGQNGIMQEQIRSTAFGILQASRVRITKTEFISCPGCGRTLFNLNQTLQRVKEQTSHLKGLKIGVMGCIVNGPGEMADADYGYVGSGPGKITLYRKKDVVKRNIPESQAVDELIELIKSNGDWVDIISK